MIAPERPFVLALNHVLDAEAWASERLAPFVGEIVELCPGPLPALRFAIADGGRAALAPADRAPSLTIRVGMEALPALARGEDALMRAVDVAGNARLAHEVLWLLRHLRWDVEEDLSRVLGDAAAHRLVAAAKQFARWQADAVRRSAEGLMEYALEEKHLLVRRAELDELAGAAAVLRDAVERLEKRVERLAGES
jgi:ubiquinone biosynthesis protein UbiJ